LIKAILLRDAVLAKRARDTIFSGIKMSSKEGIQPGFSFHQHGPQQQFGNYGLSFLNASSFWLRVL
jgi:chondroitin AC lyase